VIAILILGLLLVAAAVALITRAIMVGRLRTADNLVHIGHYGFVGTAEARPADGLHGFVESAAAGIGHLLTQDLKLVSEERLRKTLVAAGMYDTSPEPQRLSPSSSRSSSEASVGPGPASSYSGAQRAGCTGSIARCRSSSTCSWSRSRPA